MNLIEIFSIIIMHWIADFVFQTDKQAKGKSNNWSDLLSHTTTYSIIWIVPVLAICALSNSFIILWFIPITFVAHTITDYFTSRLNGKLWADGKVYYFFVAIGFDQILHYVQLFLTYYFLCLE